MGHKHTITWRLFAPGLIMALLLPSCVRRTIEISTEPQGALVWLNGREIGRTPVAVDFTHYGTYDLMVKKKGWEPIIVAKDAPVPILDTAGVDLVIEILPIDVHHVVQWHIDMERRDGSRRSLIKRADSLRTSLDDLGPDSAEKTPDDSR